MTIDCDDVLYNSRVYLVYDLIINIKPPNIDDYAAMAQYLKNYDWLHMVSIHITPDDLWRAFCDVMHEAVDMFVPSVVTRNANASRRVKNIPPRFVHARGNVVCGKR